MREVERVLGRLAPFEGNLLLQGEPGTGKRVLAEAIHDQSLRAAHPFLACALDGSSEAHAEAELFGVQGSRGLFARACGGTVYLEEIAALTPRLQHRLVQMLCSRHSDVRIIAATGVPLEELVHFGRFRQDLYYQLAVFRLIIPPLRDRSEDIAVIADHFIRRWCGQTGTPRTTLSRAALAELAHYAWPGNARELQQTLEAVLSTSRGGEIGVERVRVVLGRRPRRHNAPDVFPLRQLERDYIESVLIRCNWNQSLAARRLGIGRNTLMRKIKSYGLERSEAAA